MTFKGWQKTSLIEVPGKVCSVLFTGGCNFRCPFCYNASLVLEPDTLPALSGATVLAYLEENRRLYGAVAVTGGEPTLQEGLAEFLGEVKQMGLAAAVETNGSRPDALETLLRRKLVDFIAMDVKAPLTLPAYRRATGLRALQRDTLRAVRRSLELLRELAPEYELRCTVVPGLHREEDLLRLARDLHGAARFVLQQFRPAGALDPALRRGAPYPLETLASLQMRIHPHFGVCEVRA